MKAPVKRSSQTSRLTTKPPTKKVSDVRRHRSYVIYGVSGTGKTTLSGDFPKPLLLLDFNDKGTDSISDVKDIDVAEITSWADLEEWYYYLLKSKEYKTVVFDTVTQMQSLCVQHVLSKKGKKDTARAGDWGTMTQREWGDVAALMKQWIIQFRDLDMEVVFLAQARVFNMSEDADDMDEMLIPEVGPRLSPSVKDALNAAVDVIGSTFIRKRVIVKKDANGKKKEIEKTEYCLRIGPSPVYTTKIRKPKKVEAPAFIVDPDYETIKSIIEGDY